MASDVQQAKRHGCVSDEVARNGTRKDGRFRRFKHDAD
jgi:hypothetical protein